MGLNDDYLPLPLCLSLSVSVGAMRPAWSCNCSGSIVRELTPKVSQSAQLKGALQLIILFRLLEREKRDRIGCVSRRAPARSLVARFFRV